MATITATNPSFNSLVGTSTNDTLRGSAGKDTLDGGLGDDLLIGGGGQDTYLMSMGQDVIVDGAEGNLLSFDAWPYGSSWNPFSVAFARQGADLLVSAMLMYAPPNNESPSAAVTVRGYFNAVNPTQLDIARGFNGGDLAGFTTGAWTRANISAMLSATELGDTIDALSDAPDDRVDDIFSSGGGHDLVRAGSGGDRIHGGSGDDTLLGQSGNDSLVGEAGNDWLDGGSNLPWDPTGMSGYYGDTLAGGADNDTLIAEGAGDHLQGGEGQDLYIVRGIDGWVQIEDGRFSQDGDRIRYIGADPGQPVVPAELQLLRDVNDLIVLERSQATAVAATTDWNTPKLIITGYFGPLAQEADASSTVIEFGNGQRWTRADVTQQLNLPSPLNDSLIGSSGPDLIAAQGGQDSIDGGLGRDTLSGDDGDDQLWGGEGDDRLLGGAGQDWLQGGLGNDLLEGGEGPDVYVFDGGHDLIVDADVTQATDVYATSSYGSPNWRRNELSLSRSGLDLVLNLQANLANAAGTITVKDYFAAVADGTDPLLRVAIGDNLGYGTRNFELNQANVAAAMQATDQDDVIECLSQARLPYFEDDHVAAKAGDDIVHGGVGHDYLQGDEGNDSLYGGDGNESLYGGAGNDLLDGGASLQWSDQLYGGDGADTLIAEGYEDSLDGGAGGDTFIVMHTERTVSIKDDSVTGDGDRVLLMGDGPGSTEPAHIVLSTSGSSHDLYVYDVRTPVINGRRTPLVIIQGYLKSGDSLYSPSSQVDFIDFDNGTRWSRADVIRMVNEPSDMQDALTGTSGADTIRGLGGNDRIDGALGDDLLMGDDGDDDIVGGFGNDTLDGGAGQDYLAGGPGSDTYRFGRDGGINNIWNYGFEPGDEDVIEFTDGIVPSDVKLLRHLDFTMFMIGQGPQNSVSASDFFQAGSSTPTGLFAGLVFADGTRMTADEAGEYFLRRGTNGNDSLAAAVGGSLIDGGAGNDRIEGATGADTLVGGSGVDWLYGAQGTDRLDGGDGNDVLWGFFGQDTLIGGTGNDTLYGDEGADTYVFQKGDGHDFIEYDVLDTIAFGAGIRQDQLIVREGPYIVSLPTVEVLTTLDGEGVTIRQLLRADDRRQVNMTFADGVSQQVLPWGDTMPLNVVGTAAANALKGQNGADVFNGMGGDDELEGGAGADTYLFNLGDGRDLIHADAEDVIQLGQGINRSEVTIGQLGAMAAGTVRVGLGGTDALALDDAGQWNGLILKFADGSTLTGAQIMLEATKPIEPPKPVNLTLTGTSSRDTLTGKAGNDTLSGLGGNDTLAGGTGTDKLVGGTGADTYLFIRGDGQDTIVESDTSLLSNLLNPDLLKVGSAKSNQLWLTKSGNNLDIAIIGTKDKVTIQDWYKGSANQVEKITALGDNKSLSASKVNALVNAMAKFTAPAEGVTTLPAATQSGLTKILATSWS